MLQRDLGERIVELQKQIEASKKRRERDLEHNIKIRKKMLQTEKKTDLTQEEIDNIRLEEEKEMVNTARLHIQKYLENRNKLKLNNNQAILLKKLVDTSQRQYYDTVGT